MKTNKLLRSIAVTALAAVSLAFLSACGSTPTTRGATTGAMLGTAGGMFYDQHQKGWDGRLDRDTLRRGAVGAGVGAGGGAIIGSQAGSAPRRW